MNSVMNAPIANVEYVSNNANDATSANAQAITNSKFLIKKCSIFDVKQSKPLIDSIVQVSRSDFDDESKTSRAAHDNSIYNSLNDNESTRSKRSGSKH
jgi:hypothetical protein